jgi:hypothetical protein
MNTINVLQIIAIVGVLFLIRMETKRGIQLDKLLKDDEVQAGTKRSKKAATPPLH